MTMVASRREHEIYGHSEQGPAEPSKASEIRDIRLIVALMSVGSAAWFVAVVQVGIWIWV